MTTRELQAALNRYTGKHNLPLQRLEVDGEAGPLTQERIAQVKLCLGYVPKYATPEVTKAFRRRLVQWKHPELYRPGMIKRGIAYRRQLRKGGGGARGRALHWAQAHLGITENPAGSNRDNRHDGITAWQRRLGDWLVGLPWCGVFVANALLAGGVKGVTSRLASVALIEDDAKARRGPFSGWSTDPRTAKPGDALVLFGRGTHTGLCVAVKNGYLVTREGNTSPENGSGSQSNGGGSFERHRPFGAIRGVAHVRYPGE